MPSLKALINRKAFRHNLKLIAKIIGKEKGILPIIKADAYGHGMVQLAKESLKCGAPMLGVGTLEEGIGLRKAKIAAPVLLIDGIFKEETAAVIKHRLTPVIFSLEIASELNKAAGKAGKTVQVHLKFDTGMSRLGIPFHESEEALKKLKRLKNLKIEGVMTHLASSNESDSPQTELQLSRFNRILADVKKAGFQPRWIHAANSAAIINFPSSHYNMVRPGIVLYGLPPSPVKGMEFKPVMSVSSRLVSIKEIPTGEGIGYNATYVTPRNKRVGVVMGGYADGVSRAASNRGTVTLHGKPLPVIGNVCMDNFMIDLSKAPNAKPGDEILILDPDNNKADAKASADLVGTIPYEIVCSLGSRAEKIFI